MKHKYFNLLLICTALWSNNSFAETLFTKERVRKEINKSFVVNPIALLKVTNSYGNLNITSWEENSIVIDVEIIVEGRSLKRIKEKLQSIEIDFSSTADKVIATTNIKESWTKGIFSIESMNMEINYTIKMPVNGAVNLSNDYGAILLNQLNGNAYISCDYGKMIIGELNGSNNELHFDYTNNSTIEFIRNGKIIADYSSFEVGEAESISLNADYTNASFGGIGELVFNMDYGKLKVEEANSIQGNTDYTSLLFGAIAHSIKISADYGSLQLNKLLAGFKSVDFDLEYISTKIGVAENCSFDFEFDLEYCNLSTDLPLNYNQKIKEVGENYYKGTYNTSTSDGGTITITSEYGKLKINNKY